MMAEPQTITGKGAITAPPPNDPDKKEIANG